MQYPESRTKINEGISFEDTGMMIPWGTPIDELSSLESPIFKQRKNSVSYRWRDRRLFGLIGDVVATRFHGDPNPGSYQIYLPEFHWSSVKLTVDWASTPAKLEQGFRDTYEHLKRQFGEATFSYPKYERNLPAIFWELPKLKLSFSLLGGRPKFSVAHEPDGFEELKAKARALRKKRGNGARVDYVAW